MFRWRSGDVLNTRGQKESVSVPIHFLGMQEGRSSLLAMKLWRLTFGAEMTSRLH